MSKASNRGINPDAKRQKLQARWEAEAPAREKAARERACFWSRPFGHVYEIEHQYSTIKSTFRCVSCGRKVQAWASERPGRFA